MIEPVSQLSTAASQFTERVHVPSFEVRTPPTPAKVGGTAQGPEVHSVGITKLSVTFRFPASSSALTPCPLLANAYQMWQWYAPPKFSMSASRMASRASRKLGS